jgi:hypothetical protein
MSSNAKDARRSDLEKWLRAVIVAYTSNPWMRPSVHDFLQVPAGLLGENAPAARPKAAAVADEVDSDEDDELASELAAWEIDGQDRDVAAAAVVVPSDSLGWDPSIVVKAGVPAASVGGVLALACVLGIKPGSVEPLCDPLTLFRFFNARGNNVEVAANMYRKTVTWREEFGLPRVMSSFGTGASYGGVGAGLAAPWAFVRAPQTATAKAAQKYSCFGFLDALSPEGGPIIMWRIGAFDIAGVAREGLVAEMAESFVAHIEEVLQRIRAESLKQNTVVRARLVVDATGITVGFLSYIGVLKQIMRLGKAHYPDTTVSVTIVNAPWVFAQIFEAISPLLTPLMRKKVKILSGDFRGDFESHAKFSPALLPVFLGGETPETQCPLPAIVPAGARAEFS